MNSFKINKPKTILLFCCMPFLLAWGQNSTKQSFDVDDGAVVVLNTSHTNVVFETWRKNKVEVEAFIEGESLTKEEQEQLFKDWGLEISYNNNTVEVNTKRFSPYGSHLPGPQMPPVPPVPPTPPMPDMSNLEDLGVDIQEMIAPVLEELPNMPLLEGDFSAFSFDYEAYEKNPEEYMEKFENQIEERFGEDFEHKMEEWGQRLEARMEQRAEQMKERREMIEQRQQHAKQRTEAAAKRYEERIKAYEKRMENWGERVEQQAKSDAGKNSKAKRTIIIRMPKKATLKMNVRHGEVKLADSATNLHADLQYTALTANHIDGAATSVNVAYAPVIVNHWGGGALSLNYVDNCSLQTVHNIDMNANSSNVMVANLSGHGFLKGSFGELSIAHISDDFTTLAIELENTQATIQLPKVAYDLFYSGSSSQFQYPSSLQLQKTKAGSRETLKGFYKAPQSAKTITLTAKYSTLLFQ